jgi:hypothetical protein
MNAGVHYVILKILHIIRYLALTVLDVYMLKLLLSEGKLDLALVGNPLLHVSKFNGG